MHVAYVQHRTFRLTLARLFVPAGSNLNRGTYCSSICFFIPSIFILCRHRVTKCLLPPHLE